MLDNELWDYGLTFQQIIVLKYFTIILAWQLIPTQKPLESYQQINSYLCFNSRDQISSKKFFQIEIIYWYQELMTLDSLFTNYEIYLHLLNLKLKSEQLLFLSNQSTQLSVKRSKSIIRNIQQQFQIFGSSLANIKNFNSYIFCNTSIERQRVIDTMKQSLEEKFQFLQLFK
ncbi:unnamed protein product [Paramecium sonneborni]|uniref:Transmembrane protein n=1 Tax=Paramecium sonneborni TaxID=65129 RepID=A0A8S1NVB6_9CILI|nr:unnamed protein product [Paramecium sonneborni]